MRGWNRMLLFLGAAGVAGGAFAAKVAVSPVAPGYPSWRGVQPKNHIYGRMLLSDADLRQRITVVVEFDAAKAAEQVEATGIFAPLNGLQWAIGSGVNWENVTIPHDVMVLFVARNVKDRADVWKAVTNKDAAKFPNTRWLGINRVPVYEGVTFDGAPDVGGKYPYVYVMGAEGTEPLVKGPFDAGTANRVQLAIAAEKKRLETAGLRWRPFFGHVGEPKHFPEVVAAVAKEKPLDAVVAKLKKGILSADGETSREAQMLHDALEQTRSDLVFLAQCAYPAGPHVAADAIGRVLAYWPRERKSLAALSDRIKADPEAKALARIYVRLKVWSAPGFTCKSSAEAQRIVQELAKMKKSLAPLKTAKSVAVQNGAQAVDGMIDALAAEIPSKVASE